jgi:hypothetical protein
MALALMLIGGALRLYRLDVMEFKADEQEALKLSMALLADRPWASDRPFPAHGMPTSNTVPLPPLYTWLVAALWAPTRDPIGVATLIALINSLCLYPLWRWARRRTDENRALLILAIAAVSPFTVIFSRKIWNLDLLQPCMVVLLWGVEWLRGERPWRGIILLILAALLVGQLHLSGPIGMALLPLAIGAQILYDRRHGVVLRLGRPSVAEAAALATALVLTLFFWLPYLNHLAHQPPDVLASRPTLAVVSPALLLRTEAQIVPVDVLSFFEPHRFEFLRDPIRAATYYASLVLGAPLLLFGLWRWLRSPWSVPILGIWWWLMIAAFALARIPSHPSYVLTLAPITAMLPAGGFDPPIQHGWIARALAAWRIAYVAALFALTVAAGSWLANRGGAMGPYGVAYYLTRGQAESIVSRVKGEPRQSFAAGEVGPDEASASLACRLIPSEVTWLVGWLDQNRTAIPPALELCERWIEDADGLAYRWRLRN